MKNILKSHPNFNIFNHMFQFNKSMKVILQAQEMLAISGIQSLIKTKKLCKKKLPNSLICWLKVI